MYWKKCRKSLCNLGMGKSFLNTTPKAEAIKGKHIKTQPHAQKILM